jgi:predicted ester cyclase
MAKAIDNRAVAARWFDEFWGDECYLGIVDELAAPNMVLQFSLYKPRLGRDDIKNFMREYREAFPDCYFRIVGNLIVDDDHVVGSWEGGGTHTGPAINDLLVGAVPPSSGRRMQFTGTNVLKLEQGLIVSQVALDDGLMAMRQLGILREATS